MTRNRESPSLLPGGCIRLQEVLKEIDPFEPAN